MDKVIYLLCLGTSITCALLLLRAWFGSRVRFLLWASLCFCMIAVNNALLFLDRVVLPNVDGVFGLTFGTWRGLSALLGFILLFRGLIWDVDGRDTRAGTGPGDAK